MKPGTKYLVKLDGQRVGYIVDNFYYGSTGRKEGVINDDGDFQSIIVDNPNEEGKEENYAGTELKVGHIEGGKLVRNDGVVFLLEEAIGEQV